MKLESEVSGPLKTILFKKKIDVVCVYIYIYISTYI